MASIRKEIPLARPADEVWDAVRDLGAIHERLARGVVTDVQLDGDTRTITFANGLTVTELIVDVDDDRRRLAYAATGGAARHHHSTVEVVPDGDGARIVWVTDVLPDELAPTVSGLVDAVSGAMRATLES